MLNSKKRKAILDLQEVLDWVNPIVNGRVDDWKAARIQKVLDLVKDQDEKEQEREQQLHDDYLKELSWYDILRD